MFRKSILFLLLLNCLSFVINAQKLYNDKIDVQAGSQTDYRNAVIYLPANYSTSKKYPLVIYTHGVGEASTDVNELYTTGLPKVLKDGYRPPFDFVMIAPQRNSYSVMPEWIPGILEEAQKRWSIDVNRIYVTGIDAGGWAAYGSQLDVSADLSKKITAIVINSGVTQNANTANFDWWTQSKTPLWSVVGEADVSYAHYNGYMVDEVNKRVPGLATLTLRPNVAHGGWDDVYKGLVKNGTKNMWEWLYQFNRASTSFPNPSSTTLPETSDNTSSTTVPTGTTRYIKVNLFGGTAAYSNTQWNNWNVGLSYRTNVSSEKLKYTDGSLSTVSLKLSESMDVNDNTAYYGAGMAPAEVLRFTSYSRNPRTLTASGLSPSLKYNFEFYASRRNADNATKFTINGTVKSVVAFNNLTNKVVFTGISPDAAGQIKVAITEATTYNYLNGLTITEGSSATGDSQIPVASATSHTIYPKGTSIYLPNGLGIADLKPGDTLNIPAGVYSVIDLGNFKGTADKPIIIRNKGGQVIVNGQFRFSNRPEHFKLLGNGVPGITYGFKVDGKNLTSSGISAFGTDFEIAYTETMNTGNGFFIKKNPVADDFYSKFPNYTMKDVSIHHNYVHNTRGEGMYIGHTAPDGGQNGDPTLPVRMQNVEIAYNILQYTGWDAIQLSNATTGNKIHDNIVRNFGTANKYSQQAGILLGGNSTGAIYNNTIENGTGNGIQVFGFGTINVYNNSIVSVGKNGTDKGAESIFCNDLIVLSETRPKQQINIYTNTIKYPQPWGAVRIGGYKDNSLPATIKNNKLLIPNAPADWEHSIYLSSGVEGTIVSGNTLITN